MQARALPTVSICPRSKPFVAGTFSPPLIVPGAPEKSSLYTSLVASGAQQMPKGAAPLPKDEIQAVYEWIKRGALENEEKPAVAPPPPPTTSTTNDPCDRRRWGNEPGFKKCQ